MTARVGEGSGTIRSAYAHWDAYELDFRLREGEKHPLRSTIVPDLRDAAVEGTVYIVGGDSKEHSAGRDDPLLGTIIYSDRVLAEIEAAGDAVVHVRSREDLERARRGGAIWFVLGIEGCAPLRGQIAPLRMLDRLGIRVLGLTWNGRNEVADGVGVDSPGGLTDFGRALVTEAERLGMLVDVSHLAAGGLSDVVEMSTRPIIASHSNARALRDHRRNLTDDQLRLIASTGGLIGVNFHPTFLADGDATVAHVADQVEHIASVVGIEHVCLGPDFTYDPWRRSLQGTRSYQGVAMDVTRRYPIHRPGEMTLLRTELERRGLGADVVMRIFAGNLVSLLSRVLPTAAANAKSLMGG